MTNSEKKKKNSEILEVWGSLKEKITQKLSRLEENHQLEFERIIWLLSTILNDSDFEIKENEFHHQGFLAVCKIIKEMQTKLTIKKG